MRFVKYAIPMLVLSAGHAFAATDSGTALFAGEGPAKLRLALGALLGMLAEIADAVPDLPSALADALGLVNEPSASWYGSTPAGPLAIILVAAVLAARVMRLLLAGIRSGACIGASNEPRPAAGLTVAACDLAERVCALVVAGIGAGMLLSSDNTPSQFGFAIVATVLAWWFVMLLADILLRPQTAQLRLVALDDRAAAVAWRVVGIVVALLLAAHKLLPILIDSGLPVPHAQAIVLVTGTLVVVLVGATMPHMGIRRRISRQVAALILALFWVLLWVGVVRVDLSVIDALMLTLLVLAGAITADGLIGLGSAGTRAHRIQKVIRRCGRVVAAVIVFGILAETWLVGQMELISPAQWREVTKASFSSLTALISGYILWEAMRGWIDIRIARTMPVVGPGRDDGEFEAAPRFAALLPLFRTFGTITILLLALLVALSEWGVNIVPLLAGASIFGLAISFGSQTLVRDIVSGIFFIADDAFRVGEYVDTGRLKGTVEAISIRSVKLRHQSGQIHTIPFGEIHFITNFSRDWATLKFNLRLARDSDIEKVRKTIKRIGEEMSADAELGPELISPLKLQGVADIVDNALIVRLKFTARPIKPSWVQREALKRIHARFREAGIEFATNAVTVQSADAGAGAAAASVRPVQQGSGTT